MMKRQLIMEKALELFAKQGFESTSVQQITDFCGISKGAFYLSFKSKDELIFSLIDYFMGQFVADIDHSVREKKAEEQLYTFYYTVFTTLQNHSDFAKLFIKEQTHAFSDELFQRMRYYDSLSDQTILRILEAVYGETVELTKYDLMYSIKGFLHIYSGLFLFHEIVFDAAALAHVLVEKTDILARHTTLSFISKEVLALHEQPNISKKSILALLDEKINEVIDPIERESFLLLKQDLLEPCLTPAIRKGLIGNIQSNPRNKWISYLLQKRN